jgi:uncharacterized protein (DUF305 family)
VHRGWARPLVALLGAVGLLLLGAAAGLLVGLPGSAGTSAPTADSVDVGFAQDMSVHHQQAVQMAGWQRDHTTDPALKQLAFDIETTQLQQIGQMQGWLGLWGAAVEPPGGRHMAWMAGGAHTHGSATSGGVAAMPGMASSDELRALRAAGDQQRDVLFLQLMLRHHQGGVEMLEYGADHASTPEVRNLAAQMLTAQTGESEYLAQLLAARGGTPLPL